LKEWKKKIISLSEFYPDYGKGFLDCVLDYFDGKLEDSTQA
jgi:hypothetical protein